MRAKKLYSINGRTLVLLILQQQLWLPAKMYNVSLRHRKYARSAVLPVFYSDVEIDKMVSTWKIEHDLKEVVGKTMPPKNSGISFLTKEESDFLAQWIDAGKPEF